MNDDPSTQAPKRDSTTPLAATPEGGASRPSIQIRTILVPVDFSGCSGRALAYAIAFAQQFKASIALMHVVELNYMGTGLGEIEVPLLENELRENASRQLNSLLETVVRTGVPAEAHLRLGRPWYEMTEAARTMGADLVIMGTHGYTGLRHVLMGSTAERVVRHAPCPVLIVRELEHEFLQPEPGQPQPPQAV